MTRTPTLTRPAVFEAAPAIPGRFTLRVRTALPPGVNRREMEEDGEIESHGHQPPPGFQAGPATWLVHPPRKASDSNATVTRASASNGARRPGRFTFHEYRPGDSNPDHPCPEHGVSCQLD